MRTLHTMLVALLVAQSSLTYGQASEVRHWMPFAQRMQFIEYADKRFRLEAAVRSHPVESDAAAFLWARVDRNDGTVGFFDNMRDRPIRANKWSVYTIEGIVDTNVKFFSFGGIVQFNGMFLFDDFRLSIEDQPGHWKNIAVANGGFESDSSESWSFERRRRDVRGFSLGIHDAEAFEGRRSLKIEGNGVVNFGANDKIGEFVSANGVSLYYETYGQGPPLLLLHGNSQSINAFVHQIEFFAPQYRVIAVDSRGRGKSSIDDRELTYELQADDMEAFLTKLGIDSVSIVGWSDGGIIGLIMALKYPHRVRALIASGANIQHDHSAFFQEDIKQMTEIVNNPKTSPLERRLNALMLKYPNISFQELGKIQCPVLIVAGDKDVIRIEHTIKMFQSIPKGQLAIFPATSHYVLSENPTLFNETALKFLRESLK